MIPERTATLHASVIATVFFVVLCQLVHGIPPPIMNVTTEMYYEINDGENFYVSCTGIQPIQWTHTMGPSQSVTDGRTTKIRNDYVSVFELENAKYWQTGKIQCGYLNATNVAWIYLYVKHPRYLIANWTEDAIAKLVVDDSTDSLIIPCRPTAHDVHVVLQKDGQNIPGRFHPYSGFNISMPGHLANHLHFQCNAMLDRRPWTNDSTQLVVELKRNQPLSNPDISRAPGQSIWFIVDLRMRLQCIVSAEKYVHVEFNWALPRFSTAKNDNRFSTSETYDSDKKEYVSVLTISKTKLTDAGIYTCDVGGGSSPANYSVTVHDGSPVIQKVKAEPWNITVPVGKGVAQWVVDVLAYPPPTLSLIRTRRPDLFRKTDYEIVNNAETEGTVLVQLVGVQLEDFGNYTLKVVTATMSRSITLRVEVTDQPKVETIQFADSGMVPGSFVMVDTKVSIECIASGYPVPEIDWIFRPCETPDECEGSPVHVNEHRTRNKEAIEISRDEEYKIVSTLKLYASESGSYHCGAGFSNFYDEKKFFLRVTDIGGEDGFGVVKRVNDESTWEPLSDRFDAYEGDKIVIKCGASKFNYTNAVAWDYRTSSKGEFKPALPLNWNTSPASSDLSWGLRISLSKAGRAENGEYRCSATNTVKGERNWVAFTMNIVPMEEPAFDGTTNMFKASKAGKPMAIKNGDVLILNCSVSGVPTPNIEWLKDSMRFNETKDHRIFVNGSLLTFSPAIAEKDNGRYSCRARNKAGETEISVDLEVVATSASFGGMGLPGFFVLVTVVGLLVFTVIGACIYARKLRKDKEKLSRLLTEKEAKQFREGNREQLNPDLPVSEQIEFLPYFGTRWEIPRKRLELGQQIGRGAFGCVLRGKCGGLFEQSDVHEVAVKTLMPNAEKHHFQALLKEIKILSHMGTNLNIVNLLGAYTQNMTQGELLMIIEYCPLGSLDKYLRKHKVNFKDQFSSVSGLPVPSIRNRSFNSQSTASVVDPMAYVTMGTEQSLRENSVEFNRNRQRMSSASTESCTVRTAVTGVTDLDTDGNGRGGALWAEVYEAERNLDNDRTLSTADLLSWAYQIASGMSYLEKRKVVHRDLAARNVLLTSNYIVKICDFGLARDVYQGIYRKTTDDPIPFKWMPLESLLGDHVSSSESDVWSFGVTLWELFTLGRTPYPNMNSEALIRFLREGRRLERPLYSDDRIYNLMHSCWEAAPDQRPSFAALTSDFGALVDPQTKLRLSAMNEKFERHNGELFAEYGDFLANFGMDGGSSGSKSRSRSVTSRGTRYLPEDANGYLIPNPSLRTPSAYVVMGGGDSVRFSRDGEQPPAFYENMNVRSAEPPRVEATVANTNQTPVKPLTGQSYANQLDFSRFLSVPSSEDPGERDAGDGLHEVDPLLVKYNPGYVTSDVPSTDL